MNRNIKKIALYGICAALAIIFGFVESLIPFDFIAPGIKLGLANCVALLFVCYGDIKGAFFVNIVRIVLSAFLFSSPFSLLFSLSAGILSLSLMAVIKRFKSVSEIGVSVLGAITHNAVQILVAFLLFGGAVFYYFPFLLLSALISGAVIGIIAKLIFKKVKTNVKF